ncbi:MAG: SLATT domain-containing protein [Bacteroidales bacterium]|jgi:hypothetical protein|nr:SLATT domain-containing protein [Bacteroidales bacterium]
MPRDEFSDQMWFTYKARFNAHARLTLQDIFCSIITAVLSLFIIIINIIQLVPNLIIINQLATTCYTISLSIIILVISLVFSLSNKRKQAECFHACALEIQRIYREYTTRQNILTDEEKKGFTARYDNVLLKYNINHSHSDYQKVKITKEGIKFKSILFYYIVTFFTNCFIFILLLIVPIIIGILIIKS